MFLKQNQVILKGFFFFQNNLIKTLISLREYGVQVQRNSLTGSEYQEKKKMCRQV